MRAAQGDYVWFIDSDDLIYPHVLHQIVENLEQKECVACTFKFAPVSNDFKLQKQQPVMNLVFYEKYRCIHNPFTIITNRDYLISHNAFFNIKMTYGEDTLWAYFAQLYSEKFLDTNATIYYYRMNPTSLMHQKNISSQKKWLDSMLVMLDEYQRVLKNWPSEASSALHKQTKARVYWTVQNVLFGALRMRDGSIDKIIAELKARCLYPYPILWGRLFGSQGLGDLKVNAFCLLFPIESYLRLLKKILK